MSVDPEALKLTTEIRTQSSLPLHSKVQLALSSLLTRYQSMLMEKAKTGNVGAIKALSMFTPLRPVVIRELRKLSEDDAKTLVQEVRKFLQTVDEQ